jgi:hypothetical protein
MARSISYFRLFLAVGFVAIVGVYVSSMVTVLRTDREFHITISLSDSASFVAPVVSGNGNTSASNRRSANTSASTSTSNGASYLSTSTKEALGLDKDNTGSQPAALSVSKTKSSRIPEPDPEEDDYSTPLDNIVEFERQERVVIATKIHGPNMRLMLEQMLCLLTKAYNGRMQYDVLIFTSEAFSEEEIKSVQAVGAPANVTIVKDNPGLQTMIEELAPNRKAKFLKRCGLKTPEEISKVDFYTNCNDPPLGPQRLAYTWQCEFRSWHIWKRPELAPYKTMLWMDTDGFCTDVWDRDPVAYFIKHKLAIFFDNWPQGSSRGKPYQDRYIKAFNRSLCSLELEDGHFKPIGSANCTNSDKVPNIHGFFHITNLDFFRSDPVMYWAETLIGDEFLSRRFDDQLAVTVPTAILAPNRSWDMYSHGFRLNVFHNFNMDGKGKRPAGGFKKYWKLYGQNFTQAYGVCNIVAAGR